MTSTREELRREKDFSEQQNLVRGAVSNLRGARSKEATAKDATVGGVRRFRFALINALLSARANIAPSAYDRFLSWLSSMLAMAPEDRRHPIGFDYLEGFAKESAVVPLRSELAWVSKRIAAEAKAINLFRETANKVQALTLSGQLAPAIELLSQYSSRNGETYWALQLRIALEQSLGGLEAQKRYIGGLQARFKGSVLAFVAFYTGVRNEDRTTWRRFTEQMEDRILKIKKIRPDQINYLKYRICAVWPESVQGITDIIRLEQSHQIVDLYETFLTVLQDIAMTASLAQLRPIALSALSELKEIDDFRLDKLSVALAGDRPLNRLPSRPTALSNDLFRGDAKSALRKVNRPQELDKADPWQTIYASIAIAGLLKESLPSGFSLKSTRRLIASVLRRDSTSHANQSQLEKLSNNYAGLPYWAGLRAFLDALRENFAEPKFAIGSVSLFSSYLGPEDLELTRNTSSINVKQIGAETQTGQFWKMLRTVPEAPPSNLSAAPITLFAKAIAYLRHGFTETAAKLLGDISDETGFEPLRLFIAKARLEAEIELGNREGIIKQIAHEAVRNERAAEYLPIQRAMAGFSWNDFRPLAKGFEAAIALETLWRLTGDDTHATTLRFAFSYQLRNSGFNRPSAFVDRVEDFDRPLLIRYLNKVCTPAIMDMSPAFQSSREVMEERRAVCAALKAIDSSADYDTEIFAITNELVIADGLRLVDSSRLHVDTNSLGRLAARELGEDFARLLDLIKAGIGVNANFDEVIREALARAGGRQVFFTPGDEADSILIDLFTRLRDEFLSNSNYGLDYFLSKRIRHQSFIGLIRGPLEFAGLITTRESEFGPYRRNEALLARLPSLNDAKRNQVSYCLAEFSEKFDDLLLEIKDERFQIRGETHKNGLFEIVITGRILSVMRGILQAGMTFEEFLRVAFPVFWGSLEPSLTAARELISETTKAQVTALFDDLRQKLRDSAEGDPGLPSISISISDVSAEVQRNLDSAAAWFARPEGQQADYQFTLKQGIEIAVQSAHKSHRAFEPTLSVNHDGPDIRLMVQDLLLITDAIFIALDNVKAHSGLKRPPSEVQIVCSVDENEEFITLHVENTVAQRVRTPEAEAKLTQLRERIASKVLGKATKSEGGSGFIKLAAALQQSAEGKLTFGFVDDTHFELVMRLRATQITYSVVS